MASFYDHLVNECNVDVEAELATSCERDIPYRGRVIEVYYAEYACCWRAFVMGLGEFSRRGEIETIAAARVAIDLEFTRKASDA